MPQPQGRKLQWRAVVNSRRTRCGHAEFRQQEAWALTGLVVHDKNRPHSSEDRCRVWLPMSPRSAGSPTSGATYQLQGFLLVELRTLKLRSSGVLSTSAACSLPKGVNAVLKALRHIVFQYRCQCSAFLTPPNAFNWGVSGVWDYLHSPQAANLRGAGWGFWYAKKGSS